MGKYQNDKMEELEALSRPLIEWLNDNFHPHVTIIITPGRVDLLEGVFGVPIPDYIKD